MGDAALHCMGDAALHCMGDMGGTAALHCMGGAAVLHCMGDMGGTPALHCIRDKGGTAAQNWGVRGTAWGWGRHCMEVWEALHGV